MEALKGPLMLLRFTGLLPEKDAPILQKMRGVIFYYANVIFAFSLLIEITNHFDDFSALSGHLSISISPISYLFKIFMFRNQKKYFNKVMELIKKKEFLEYPVEMERFVNKSVKLTKLFGLIYVWSCASVISLYSVMPFIENIDLPVMFSYNIGSYKWAMYAFQVFGLANAASNNSSLDILAIGFLGFASSQIDILCEKLKKFEFTEKASTNKAYLRNCARHHIKIIKLIRYLEHVFSNVILIQYLTSAIVICNIGFHMTHMETLGFQFVKMFLYFLAMMMQLMMYCWYGNEIIIKSSAIKNSCYEGGWLDSDIITRRFLCIISERSNKFLFLTAGKFSILSLQSFTSVIKTSYSYFALLQTLYSKNKS